MEKRSLNILRLYQFYFIDKDTERSNRVLKLDLHKFLEGSV